MRNAILKLNNSREKLKNFWNYLKDRYNNRIEDNMKYSFEYNKMKVEEKKFQTFSKMFIKYEINYSQNR